MKKSIIVAQSTNRVIGKNNQLPWHLPADLAHFKKTTYAHPIIMGRATYQSIGRPLPKRTNIILTRNTTYSVPTSCKIAYNLDQAFAHAKQTQAKEVFIIGGAQIYAQALPIADILYLTQVHTTIEGDTFFPPIDPTQWKEISKKNHPADSNHPYAYTFIKYLRKRT